jgi:predicted transcriptional regulator
VGKETDRRWEQGEDLSLVEFKAVEYQGSKQVVASEEIKEQILKTGIRKVERETKVSYHTINKILKGLHIRRKTLAKIVRQVQSMNNTDRLGSGALT